MSLPSELKPYDADLETVGLGGLGWVWWKQTDPLRNKTKFVPLLILEYLGGGAMGNIYLAADPNSGEVCVCKYPQNGTEDRFAEEVRLLKKITHRNIVRFRNSIELVSDSEDTLSGYLMEYIAGGTLYDLLHIKVGGKKPIRRKVPLREALRIFGDLINGLEAIHTNDVLHRDLKPENILFDATEGRAAKLCDFGLAKDNLGDLNLTSPTDIVWGTPGYVAPEVTKHEISKFQGNPDDTFKKDYRADYFSIGCILAEMLSGTKTFPVKKVDSKGRKLSILDFMKSTLGIEPQGLKDVEENYGKDVEDLLGNLLNEDPAKRLTDPGEIRERVSQILKNKRRSTNKEYWREHWPEISKKQKEQLNSFLRADPQVFNKSGIFIALFTERLTLINFKEALLDIQRMVWITFQRIQQHELYRKNKHQNNVLDMEMLGQQTIIEFEKDCAELKVLFFNPALDRLISQLKAAELDKPLIDKFLEVRKEFKVAISIGYLSMRGKASKDSLIKSYKAAVSPFWNQLYRLQAPVNERIMSCSHQLMVELTRIK